MKLLNQNFFLGLGLGIIGMLVVRRVQEGGGLSGLGAWSPGGTRTLFRSAPIEQTLCLPPMPPEDYNDPAQVAAYRRGQEIYAMCTQSERTKYRRPSKWNTAWWWG